MASDAPTPAGGGTPAPTRGRAPGAVSGGASPTEVLRVEDLVVSYRGPRTGAMSHGRLRAVDGVSLQIGRGETVGLVGESGSGKSTLGRAVLQLIPIESGTVVFEGIDLVRSPGEGRRRLRRHAQMVFQNPLGSLNARMRVGRIVQEPLDVHRVGDRLSRRRRVLELLDQVGLPSDSARRYPHEFSGGQQQRIALARALASEPSLIICDEPVAALDVSIQAQILQLLHELQGRSEVSYLFIAHDLNVVRHVSRRAVVMYVGGVVEEGPAQELFRAPRHPYTQALVAAVPAPDPAARQHLVPLQGEVPNPTDLPAGCRFHTRCPYARLRCATEAPVLAPAGGGVSVACHYWREIATQRGPAIGDAPGPGSSSPA